MTKLKLTGLLAAAALTLGLVAGCSSSPSDTTTPSGTTGPSAAALSSDAVPGFKVPGDSDLGGKNHPVKVGVVGAGDPQFRVLTDAAQAEGIYIDFQDFTDYAQLNPALAAKQLDMNQFQHIIYLAKYNISEKQDLTPIGSTAIYPLSLFSRKYTSVNDIPAGATITIPDDLTNQARGLQVLQSAGLIKLKDGTPTLSGQLSDIDQAASKVKLTPMPADQTPRSLDDPTIAAAIINNDYVADSGFKPQDAIAKDDPNSDGAAPFINIWVSRAEDKDSPLFAEIIRLAHTDAWDQALLQNSAGSGLLVNETPARLQEVLADVTAQLKNG